ncbi:hypothetical protein LMG28614_04780 [Paraburkholderia ultramafica]|uniref:RND efflux pump membrane fusion protein barrel-sandwich domain-containing protein n=1 Tax=Paraburkholderia ultramafica TaxID=1544867 RepID=A0A6S7BT50_9BURK|nr:hypothetical protein LMG28614_04780 [Paraburkholderia ultramafica]
MAVARSWRRPPCIGALYKTSSNENSDLHRPSFSVANFSAVQRSDAAVLAAKRELEVLNAEITDAQARVGTALAAQRVAALNVEYTTIRSPVDGYIGSRTARVGMLANIGALLLTVVPSQSRADDLVLRRIGT